MIPNQPPQHIAYASLILLDIDNSKLHPKVAEPGDRRDMNPADLIEQVAAEHGVAKERAKKILDSALAAFTAAASAGEEVALAGFGRLKVTDRAERQGRNPATGETVIIAASRKLAFTAAKSVRDTLNADRRPTTSQRRAIPAG
jgi:DNA-binding protein HU-beta